MNKRMSDNFSFGISYTWSHSIDDGPNPSFVLIPQDSLNLEQERASSADDVRNRFVGNAIFSSPKHGISPLRDFGFGTIVTLQSPQYFTKYAGFDSNGDVFGNNDRVGNRAAQHVQGRHPADRGRSPLPHDSHLARRCISSSWSKPSTCSTR